MFVENEEQLRRYLSPRGRLKQGLSNKEKTAVFIYRSKEKYGDNFDYSRVIYEHNAKKVILLHRECGNEILVTPNSHLKKNIVTGCSHCGHVLTADSTRGSLSEAIKLAKALHTNYYDYSNVVEYINRNQVIDIICPVHGVFSQRWLDHINNGNGCPSCTDSNVIYFWRLGSSNTYKIGVTSRGLGTRRIEKVAVKYGYTAEILLYEYTMYASKIEGLIKEALSACYDRPITYGDGYTEMFSIPEKDIDGILEAILMELE